MVLWGDPGSVLLAGAFTLALVPGTLGQQYGLAILQGQRRFQAFNLLRLLPLVLYSSGLIAMFALNRHELPVITLIWVCSWVGVGLTTLSIALRGLPKHEPEQSPPSRASVIRFGLKGLLGWSSPIETFRLDQAVVGLFLSPAALGLYVVGLAFTNLPRFLAESIGMVAYPHVAAMPDVDSARRALWRYLGATVALSFMVVAALEGLAGWLVPFFFGNEFADAVPVTRILLIGALFLSARRILTEAARGVALAAEGSIAEAASWLVLLPSLLLLVPPWGIEGVAAAVALSSAFSFAVLVTLVVRGVPRGPSVDFRSTALDAP
jgi:O-antigen/teichoic acid export membrane protein